MLVLASPEHEMQPSTLFHANDYIPTLKYLHDVQTRTGEDKSEELSWYEISLVRNADGSKTVTTTKYPFTIAPDDIVTDSGLLLDPEGEKTIDGELFDDATHLVFNFEDKAGRALQVFGYDVSYDYPEDDDSKVSIRVTYDDVDTLNETLAEIHGEEKWLTIKEHDGDEFPATTMALGLKEHIVYVSKNPRFEMHDMIVHIPSWLVMTKSLFDKIANHTNELFQHVIDSQKSGNATAIALASHRFKDHMITLESELDNRFISRINYDLRDSFQYRSHLVDAMSKLIHAKSAENLTADELADIDTEVVGLMNHVRTLIALTTSQK